MLRQRSISAVGVVLFAAIPAFIGGYVFAAALLIITVAGIREALKAYSQIGHQPFRRIAQLSGVSFLVVAALEPPSSTLDWLIPLFVLVTMLGMLVRTEFEGILVDWTLSLATVMYVALPLLFAVALRNTEGPSTQQWSTTVAGWFGSSGQGLAWVGIVFSVTWLTDTAAYLVGRQFGRTKLAPRLSPGKTRAGAAGGIVAGTAAGALAAWIFGASINIIVACSVGFILSVAGQLGDLAESAIKRSLGIKDMGDLIPGHGGVLDRIDALLFTFPVAYVLVQILAWVGWS